MKCDHYIIPICSLSTSVLDAICYLTQLTTFVFALSCDSKKEASPDYSDDALYSVRGFCYFLLYQI